MSWIKVASTEDFQTNSGVCVLVNDEQIAIFNSDDGCEWYAVQNMCPHKKAMVLSRGIIGDQCGEPKVACPLHKHAFSLKTGEHLGGDESYQLKTYPVRIEGESILIKTEAL